MRTIYLDSNATSRPAPDVVEAMRAALETYWENPSSVHRPGQAARHRVELARESIAHLLGARSRDIVLTSGGTEADNLALIGSVAAQPERRVVATAQTEHGAVRETAEALETRGSEVVWLELDGGQLVDLDALESLLKQRSSEIAIVSVMWCNNETGVIQPVERIGALCREHGVRFHTDAVQWVGKMPTDLAGEPFDLLSFSAHKFHGPKGIGGLWVRRGVHLEPRAIGGGQERARRGGTENVPGICGLGAAAELAEAWLETDERSRLGAMRDRFETALRDAVPDFVVNGADAPRMWNTANVSFPRLEAEAILLGLSERGVCASAGAACSSGSLEPSPVLLALGIPAEVAHGAVRFSLSRETTDEEIDTALGIVVDVTSRLRETLPT
jgi:cysteine desulfurase